jgi:predicted transcriptional regulator
VFYQFLKSFYQFLSNFTMNFIKQLSLVAMIAVSFTACKKKDPVADAADAMCTCSKPMAALSQEMDAMKDKPDELMKHMADFEKTAKEFKTCMQGIEEKYNDKKGDATFSQAIKTAMEGKCKDVTDVMAKQAAAEQAQQADMAAQAAAATAVKAAPAAPAKPAMKPATKPGKK